MLNNVLELTNNYLVRAGIKVLLMVLHVYMTKFVFIEYGFPNLTLTSMQLLFAFIAVTVLNRFGLVQRKRMAYQDLIISSVLLICLSVFTNLSIDYNAVEVSQMFRLAQIPTGVVLMMILIKKPFSIQLKLSALIFVVALIINSVFDFTFDTLGIVFAIAAALFGSLYAFWMNKKQSEEEISPLQMLLYQLPIASFVIILFSPVVENNFELNGLFDTTRPLEEWLFIIFSCILAALFYMVTFFPIETGNSPMTHLVNNSIIYISLIIITIIGDIEFDEPLEWQQIGCLVSLPIGIVLFSKYRAEQDTDKHVLI